MVRLFAHFAILVKEAWQEPNKKESSPGIWRYDNRFSASVNVDCICCLDVLSRAGREFLLVRAKIRAIFHVPL